MISLLQGVPKAMIAVKLLNDRRGARKHARKRFDNRVAPLRYDEITITEEYNNQFCSV